MKELGLGSDGAVRFSDFFFCFFLGDENERIICYNCSYVDRIEKKIQ